MAIAAHSAQARSLYRRLLRELPNRTPSILANPSPIQQQIRSNFVESPSQEKAPQRLLEEADQYVQYLKSQRLYITLVERYNPGMVREQQLRFERPIDEVLIYE